MNYATIKPWDIANGPGVRVSVFVSGCTHRCKNCFNAEAWDFNYGEPFDPRNQAGLLELSKKLRAAYPQKSIWSFTGYVYGKNLPQVPGVTDALLASLDVLVDGPFIEEQKNLRLRFRGSENQRLIDMPQTLKAGTVVLWDEDQ